MGNRQFTCKLISIKKPGTCRLRSFSNGLLLEAPYMYLFELELHCTLGDRSFQVATPKLWNALPHEIRSISNINTLKRHVN